MMRFARWELAIALVAIAGCSSATGLEACDTGAAIALDGGSCLVFEDGGRLAAHRAIVEGNVREVLLAAGRVVPVDEVVIRVGAGTNFVIPEIGFGARTNSTQEIQVVLDPSSPNLPGALGTELFPLLAHELHHVARFRTAGFNSNLLESIITEGLADQFSIELAHVDPPIWSTALSGNQLESWIERSRAEWFNSSYDHDAWFFGSTPTVPRWAGYSIGFELTRRYLVAHATRRPSQLIGEPASSFVKD
jgi:hypothetical protein